MLNKVRISDGALYGCNVVWMPFYFAGDLNILRHVVRLMIWYHDTIFVEKYYTNIVCEMWQSQLFITEFRHLSNLCFRDQWYVLFLRCIILLLVQRNPSPFLMKRDIFYVSKTFVGETWESYPVKIQGMYSNFVTTPPSS